MLQVDDLLNYISKYIQGGFWPNDARVLKEEIEKLKSGDVYVEIGVDEGKSARVAHEYAPEGVYLVFIDIHDHGPVEGITISRAAFMEQEGMVGIDKRGAYIHADANTVAKWFDHPVSLIFIDGHHDYESVKLDTLSWQPKMKKGATMLFHDTDYTDGVPKFLDDHFGKDKWENCHGKVGRVKLK